MAKTNAERQQAYRDKQRVGMPTKLRINSMVNISAKLSLDRLAEKLGLTLAETIEYCAAVTQWELGCLENKKTGGTEDARYNCLKYAMERVKR